jgi:hypothetical protein
VKTLERKFGQTNPAEIKLADAYARDVLGDVLYAALKDKISPPKCGAVTSRL